MSMEEKEEKQLLDAMKAMKNVDWKKVIKVLAKIQQTEGKDDGELNDYHNPPAMLGRME